jgi:hypothetical protein
LSRYDYPSNVWGKYEATRVHDASRRRGGDMAASCTPAAVGVADSWISKQLICRRLRGDGGCVQTGLKEAGRVEGQNVTIEYRWADNVYDRLPALAAELVSRRVAVIVANGPAIAAADEEVIE